MGVYTGGCFHAHGCWCSNLPHTACCDTASASRTNGKHTVTARSVHAFLAHQHSVVCFVLLLFFRGTWCCGATHTDTTVCSGTFYTVKPNGSSRCYMEREDVVHCWNAASSQVKISILETANIGSCAVLNPVALCKAGSVLSGSADTTEQGRPGPSVTGHECSVCIPSLFLEGIIHQVCDRRECCGGNICPDSFSAGPGLSRGIPQFPKSGRPQAKQIVKWQKQKALFCEALD